MPSGPNNADTDSAWRYHNGTKHSYQSVRANPHYLDWPNRPLPFKIYPTLNPLHLPKEVPQTGMAALSVIADNVRPAEIEAANAARSRPTAVFLGGDHQAQDLSGRRNLPARGGLHGRVV